MRKILCALSILSLAFPLAGPVFAQIDGTVVTRSIFFSSDSTLSIDDNFGDGRSGGRLHEGIDIMGSKMLPLYAAVDGRVRHLNIPEESWGYAIVLEDDDGYRYHYLHVNNDSPGTDDGAGGTINAYAPGILEGATLESSNGSPRWRRGPVGPPTNDIGDLTGSA